MREPFVIEQTAEGFQADASLPDVLMAVELRSARGFCVVAMPDVNVLEPDGAIKLVERVVEPGLADDVIPRDVGVARVDTGSAGYEVA